MTLVTIMYKHVVGLFFLQALIHVQDLEAWANGAPPLPNNVSAAAWRAAADSHNCSRGGAGSSSACGHTQTAGPFLLLPPPSSCGLGYGARTVTPVVQVWEDHRGGGSSRERGQCVQSTGTPSPDLPSLPAPPPHAPPPRHLPQCWDPTQQHSQNLSIPGRNPLHTMLQAPDLPPSPLKRIKLFSLNDYLGLGSHPEVAAAAAAAVSAVRF